MPGTYTVEFVITEEINGEEFDYVKAVKIKIPGDEDEGNADQSDEEQGLTGNSTETDSNKDSNSTFDSGLGLNGETNSDGSKIVYPTMKLVSISKAGVVRLEFSLPIIQEYDMSNLNQTHLQLTVKPYDESMQMYLDFTWETIRFEETYVELLLDFVDPLYVS